MNALRLTFVLPMLAALAIPARAGEHKVVVELFTSQGCSSCPPADRLLGELTQDKRLLALSLPVDYWDYLGWHDTLAKTAYTRRQRGYSEMRGGHEVFTPQVIVNGVAQVVGSDRGGIETACEKAAKEKQIPVTLRKNGAKIDVEVGGGGNAPASVWLLSVEKAKPVVIGRGENHGKTITYHNVVRNFRKIADWHGSPVKDSISVSDVEGDGADMIAVLVQPGTMDKPGPIRGAAAIDLH